MRETRHDLKWWVVFVTPLVIGAMAWCFQIERSISSINTSQVYTMNSMKEIKEDLREIKKTIFGISTVSKND